MVALATTLSVVVVVAVVLIGLVVVIYNKLVTLRNRFKTAFSQIDVQLKRRHDLIPNLVETAKGYLKHEREVLENVTKARQQAIDASGVKDQAQAENFLTSTLRSLFAVVENYPDLKASDNFLNLQASLNEVEEQISAARRAYNASVKDYNNALEMFPSNLVAGLMRYQQKMFFEIDAREAQPVDVGRLFET